MSSSAIQKSSPFKGSRAPRVKVSRAPRDLGPSTSRLPDFQTSFFVFLFFFCFFFVQGQKVSRDLVPVVTSRKPVVTSDPSRKSSKTHTK